jgi:putative ABC transport system permease protein
MFRNYLLVAVRNIAKQKLFTIINITGLVIGLMALVLANGIVNYEQSYDAFFPDQENIYSISGTVNPTSGEIVRSVSGVPAPLQPLIAANVPGVEYSARLWMSERVARVEENRFYQTIRFADPDYLKIFELEFIAGDASTALATRDGLILSETAVRKYFGDTEALGQAITIDNQLDLRVTGIIRDLPSNSHFTNAIIGAVPFEFIARMEIFEELTGANLSQAWGDTSSNNLSYVMLEEGVSAASVDDGLTYLHDTFKPEQNDFLVGFFLTPLVNMNVAIWEQVGLPVPQSIRFIGLLILLVAIINYSNLANAQTMGRFREIGLRKSFGASRQQLFLQFLSESVTISAVALAIAIGLSILLLGPLNSATGRAFNFAGLFTPAGLLLLAGIALATGFLGGIYPALKISKSSVANCLSDRGLNDSGRGRLRNLIIGFQFGIAILLASCAAVIYAQNLHINDSSRIFDRENIVLLDRVGRPGVEEKFETLKGELLRIPEVQSVTASNNVPFEQSSSTSSFSLIKGDRSNAVDLLMIYNDHDFMATYEIPILLGRDFAREMALDTYMEAVEEEVRQESVNIILNRMATQQLGWESPEQALDKGFFYASADSAGIEFKIVGVIEDLNYQGTVSRTRPMMFTVRPTDYQTAAIHLSNSSIDTIAQIDDVWDSVNPDYPVERRVLVDELNKNFKVIQGLAGVLGGFALVAVFVAFIGLFGLSAFVTKARTKEIGLRKMLGATVSRLIRQMVYQISIPIVAAIIPATVLAWAAMSFGYLQLFSDRLSSVIPFVAVAAIVVLILAWAVVSYHAWRVARNNPIQALRYE